MQEKFSGDFKKMDFCKAMEYINSFSKSGKPLKDLSRIGKLMEKLGDPQNKLSFVHIAGTNGKGSVLEYASNVLIDAGYKTGQFTSPFMITYCDRIRINNKNIPEEKVADIFERLKETIKENDYSQFEISFAAAMLYFVEEKCDIVFLEAGIGGDLDATNIIKTPLVSVLTSVSLDHTNILGDTVEEIAKHKLGIVKNKVPLVISYGNKETVYELAEKTAKEKGSAFICPEWNKCMIKNESFSGSEIEYKGEIYNIQMCGKHQIINALTAVEVSKVLKKHFNISEINVKNGISAAKIPLRIEIIKGEPHIIIDGGHNTAGLDSLSEVLDKMQIKNAVGIFGMVYGKPADHGVKILSDHLEKVFCVDGFIENNIPAKELALKFQNNGINSDSYDYRQGVPKALDYARNHNKVLIVSGSLYLTSCVKNMLNNYQ